MLIIVYYKMTCCITNTFCRWWMEIVFVLSIEPMLCFLSVYVLYCHFLFLFSLSTRQRYYCVFLMLYALFTSTDVCVILWGLEECINQWSIDSRYNYIFLSVHQNLDTMRRGQVVVKQEWQIILYCCVICMYKPWN